jgi:hypothetical protein
MNSSKREGDLRSLLKLAQRHVIRLRRSFCDIAMPTAGAVHQITRPLAHCWAAGTAGSDLMRGVSVGKRNDGGGAP